MNGCALGHGQRHGVLHRLILFLLVQEFEDPLGRRHGGLEQVAHLGHLGQGLGEVADILAEGHDVADLNDLFNGQPAAQNGDGHVAEVAHKGHNRHHHTGQELGFPGGMVQGIVGFVEGVGDAFLVVEGLDDVVPAVDLLHLAVDVAQVFLLRLEVFLGFLRSGPDEAQEIGRMIKVMRVISQLMVSIMISTPMMVVTAVMIWVRLWFRLWDRVSTSLVT